MTYLRILFTNANPPPPPPPRINYRSVWMHMYFLQSQSIIQLPDFLPFHMQLYWHASGRLFLFLEQNIWLYLSYAATENAQPLGATQACEDVLVIVYWCRHGPRLSADAVRNWGIPSRQWPL